MPYYILKCLQKQKYKILDAPLDLELVHNVMGPALAHATLPPSFMNISLVVFVQSSWQTDKQTMFVQR